MDEGAPGCSVVCSRPPSKGGAGIRTSRACGPSYVHTLDRLELEQQLLVSSGFCCCLGCMDEDFTYCVLQMLSKCGSLLRSFVKIRQLWRSECRFIESSLYGFAIGLETGSPGMDPLTAFLPGGRQGLHLVFSPDLLLRCR